MARGGGIEFVIKSSADEATKSLKELLKVTDELDKSVRKVTIKLNTTSKSTKQSTTEQTKHAKETKKSADSYKNLTKQMNNFSKAMTKLRGNAIFFWNITTRIRRAIKDTIVYGTDFIETQNLFNVSMKENAKSAYEFRDAIAETFGLARTEIMSTQASFKNMLSALGGITDEMAYTLSESLMLMSIDYSSLFNVSLDKTYEKFKSAISGMTKPIRDKTGLDITESTIQQVASNIGVTKSVRQLNQVEKRLLRIISLQEQMTAMGTRLKNVNGEWIGDFAKTIEQPANQFKVMQEQIKELKTQLGIIFLEYIKPALPYVNAILMTLVEIVKVIGAALGIVEDMQGAVVDDPLQIEDGTMNDLEDAAEKIDDIKTGLIGIDELNVLGQEKESANIGSSLQVDPAILNALTGYQTALDGIYMKARQISDEWLRFLGLVKDEDGKWALKDTDGLIGKIIEKAKQLQEFIANIDWEKLAENLFGLVKFVAETWDYLLLIFAITHPFFLLLYGIYQLWKGITGFLKDNKLDIEDIESTMKGVSAILLAMGLMLRSKTLLAAAGIVYGVYLIFEGIKGILDDNIVQWKDIKSILLGVALIAGVIGLITGQWGIIGIAAVVGIFAVISEGLRGLNDRLNEGTATWKDTALLSIAAVIGYFIALIEFAWNLIVDFVSLFASIILIVIFAIAGVVAIVIDSIANPIIALVNGLIAVYNSMAPKGSEKKYLEMNYHSKQVGREFAAAIESGIIGEINKRLTGREHALNPFDLPAYDAYYKGLEELVMSPAPEVKTQTDLLKKQTEQTNEMTQAMKNIETLIETLLKGMENENLTLPTGFSIQGYANGGFPTTGELFLAREAGAEFVGSIGGRTGVANNEQLSDIMYGILSPMMSNVVASMQEIAAQDRTTVVNVDSREIAKATQKGNRKIGYSQIGGVFANV